MEEQQNNQSEKKGLGAPPPQQINIRTMQSDLTSVARGEARPVPESVMPPEFEKEPMFRPETANEAGVEIVQEQTHGGKKMVLWIVVALAVIGVGLLGYFVIFPLVFKEQPAPPPPVGGVQPPALVPQAPHHSFFDPAATAQANMVLNTLSLTAITSNLQTLSATRLGDGTVQEVAVVDAQGGQVPFTSFLNVFVPALAPTQLSSWFEDDFTAFLYYDASGVWPGYAAKVKADVSADDARNNIAALESADLSGFYVAPPGTFSSFKAGQVNGKPTRYASATQAGAALNYGILNNYLVISASYNGLKAVAPLLGF